MANTDGKRATKTSYVRFSVRMSIDDVKWVDKEAERLSRDDGFRGRLTRSDLVRGLIRGARDSSK